MAPKKSDWDRETEILYKTARQLGREWAAPLYIDTAKWGNDDTPSGKVTPIVTRAQKKYRAATMDELKRRRYEVAKSYDININDPRGWEQLARKLLEIYVPECRYTTSKEFANSALFAPRRSRGGPSKSLSEAESYYRAVNIMLADMQKRTPAVKVATDRAISKVWKNWQPEFGKRPSTKGAAVTLYHRCKRHAEKAVASPLNSLMGITYDPLVGWIAPPIDPLGRYED